MTILSDGKRQDITTRFKKTADGVYVEAKRSAIGGMTQVPLYFYGLLLALGWNEIVAGKLSTPSPDHTSPIPSLHACLYASHETQILTPKPSTPQPSLFHIPHYARRRRIRHIHAQSMGTHVSNGQCRICTSIGRR